MFAVRRGQPRRHVVREHPEAPRPAHAVRRVSVPAVPDQGGRARAAARCSTATGSSTSTSQHSGGAILDVGSDAYFTLQTWLENGATENGLKPPTPPQRRQRRLLDRDPAGLRSPRPYTARTRAFGAFKRRRPADPDRPRLHAPAAATARRSRTSTSRAATTDEQLAFNFSQAWSFVNDPVDDSQLLRVPLAVARGGRGHTGGDQFAAPTTTTTRRCGRGRRAVGKLDFAGADPGKQFFEDNVQPVLLQRGCAFQACHSPQASNDFKLRCGAIGLLLRGRAREELRPAPPRVHGARVPRRAARPRGRQDHPRVDDPRVGRTRSAASRTAAGRCSRPRATRRCPARSPTRAPGATTPATVDAVLHDPGVGPHRARRARRRRSRRWPRAARPRSSTSSARPPPTAGRLEFDTFQGGADLSVVDTHVRREPGARARRSAAARPRCSASCAGLGRRDRRRPGARRRERRQPRRVRRAHRAPTIRSASTSSTSTAATARGSRRRSPTRTASRSTTSIRRGRPTARTSCSRRRAARPARRARASGSLPQSDLWRVADQRLRRRPGHARADDVPLELRDQRRSSCARAASR